MKCLFVPPLVWANMNILFIIKVINFVFLNGQYICLSTPPRPTILLTIELRIVIMYWAPILSLLNACVFISILGATPNHTLLKYGCRMKISSWIIHVYLTTHFFSTKSLTWEQILRNPLVVHNHKKQLNTKGGLSVGSELQNTWGFNGIYSWTQNWIPTWNFVYQTRKSIFLSVDCRSSVGTWCQFFFP